MKRIIFWIARKKFLGSIVGFVISYIPFILPIKKVFENKFVIGFYHPVPTYKNHILIIPKKILKTVLHIDNSNIFLEVVNAANTVIQKSDMENDKFLLFINGGKRQDVMQTHFHLIPENIFPEKSVNPDNVIYTGIDEVVIEYNKYDIFESLIKIYPKDNKHIEDTDNKSLFQGLISILAELNKKYNLLERKFSVIMLLSKNNSILEKINIDIK